MRCGEVVAQGRQASLLPTGRAEARRFPPVVLLTFLLLFSLVAAQIDSGMAPDSGTPDILSTAPDPQPSSQNRLLPLPDECNPFWKNGWATPYALQTVTGGVVYDPTVHQILSSADISHWNPGSARGAQSALPSQGYSGTGAQAAPQNGLAQMMRAQGNGSKARAWAENESRDVESYSSAWFSNFGTNPISRVFSYLNTAIPFDFSLRVYDTLTPKGMAGIPLRIRPGLTMSDVLHYVPMSVSYTREWQAALQSATTALHEGADGVNAAFGQAQIEADTLQAMGAGDADYLGGAKPAFMDWQVFVQQSSRWSQQDWTNSESTSGDSLAGSAPSSSLTDDQRYGRAWSALHQLQQTCLQPGEMPNLSSGAGLSTVYNDLAGDGQTTLWSMAWRRYSALRAAEAQMRLELDRNRTAASSASIAAQSALAEMRTDGPGNFSQPLPLLEGSAPTDVRPAEVSGTLAEQAASAQSLHQQAESELELAQQWSNLQSRKDYSLMMASAGDSPGWASQSLAHLQRAILDERQSWLIASNVQEQMRSQTDQARSRAQSLLELAQANLSQSMSSNALGSQASAQSAARALVVQAQAKIGQAPALRGLGNQYASYLQAISLLSRAQSLLSGQDSISEGYALNQTLAQYRALLKDGPGLGVDVSDWQASYDNFFSSLSGANVAPGSSDLALTQLQSLRGQLRQALSGEEEQYQALVQTSNALAAYSPSSPSDLAAAFASYHKADGWSDLALENPAQVRSLLNSWQAKTDALASKALAQMLCANARWEPAVMQPMAGVREEAGGQWSSLNSLSLDYASPLTVDCPLSVSFLPGDLAGHSSQVLSASSSGHQLRLSLASLAAQEVVWVNFSSTQIPFQLNQKSCALSIDSAGMADWQANYTLQADQPASTLAVDIPWPSSSGGAATLSWSGLSISGQWSASPDASQSPQVRFLIPNLPAGPQAFSIDLQPDVPIGLNISQLHALPSSDGSMDVSYQLQLSGLPACSQAVLERQDGSSAALSKISAQSADASSRALSTISPDGRWFLLLRNWPANGSALVQISYQTADAAGWFNATLDELSSQAQGLQDEVALAQLSSAQRLYQAGQYSAAYAQLRAVQTRLEGEMADGGQAARDWDAESAAAGQSISQLKSLYASLNSPTSLPPWFNSLPGWTNALTSALESCISSAQAGHFETARANWRKAKALFEQKSLTAGQADYETLAGQLSQASTLMGDFESASSNSSLAISSASSRLSDARLALQMSDAPAALSALAAAREQMDGYGLSALAQAKAQAQAQRGQAAALQSLSSNLSAQWQLYLNALSALSSAGGSAFHPPLTAAQARALLDQTQKAAPDSTLLADPSGWNDASKASSIIRKQAQVLSKSNQTLLSLQSKADAAVRSIQSAAEQMQRVAQASVAQAHQYWEKEGAAPADTATASTLASLDSDLQRLDELSASQSWPDALALGQSIVSRARPLVGPPPSANAGLPLPAIALTALLIAGVGYVVVFRKPGEPKPAAQTGMKKLERA